MPNTYKLVEFVLSLFKQLCLQRRLSPDTWLFLGKHRAILGHDNGHCRETLHMCHTAALEWHCYSNTESAARTAHLLCSGSLLPHHIWRKLCCLGKNALCTVLLLPQNGQHSQNIKPTKKYSRKLCYLCNFLKRSIFVRTLCITDEACYI